MEKQLTVIIHTRNEEENIKECINSARLVTSKIIVIDMESTDKTKEIAESMNVAVKSFPFSRYVEPARKYGIGQAKTDWVFILDADERMTEALAKEINTIISNSQFPNQHQSSHQKHNLQTTNYKLRTAFRVPRKNIFGKKKWLKHGGWWPDAQIRLLNKKYLKEWPERIHSTPVFEGEIGQMNEAFLHYFHGDITKMVEKTMTYEEIEAQLLYEAGRQVSTVTFFRKFAGELFRRLILKRGFLDGTYGIIESFYQAYSKTITYLYLFEKYQHEKSRTV